MTDTQVKPYTAKVRNIAKAAGVPPDVVNTIYWLRKAGFSKELMGRLFIIKNGQLKCTRVKG